MITQHRDFVSDNIKLSAGHITKNGSTIKTYNDNYYNYNDPFNLKFDPDFEPITHYNIRCFADCDYQSGNIKIQGEKCPVGYCIFTTGRCKYESLFRGLKQTTRGLDTRVILGDVNEHTTIM